MEENHSYSSVIGSSSMPYLNSLAQKYGLATQYYANTHPSIGNYLMMTTGQIITNSDGYTGTVTADNIVRHLLTAGITWKSYAESLPSVGYTGGDKYPYILHHNPLAYFSDVRNSSVQKLNLVPFPQFATDLANNQLPQFSFVVPNLLNDAHDGTLAQADGWLKTNIAPLIASPTFQKDGLLVIVFDESSSTDTAHGGGRVAFVVVSPTMTAPTRSSTLYQHQNVLRMVMTALGLTSFPGAAASASSMSDLFSAPSPTCVLSQTSPSVTICSPTSGSSLSSPAHVVAATTSSSTVTATQIYLDGVKVYQVNSPKLDTYLTMSTGTHRLTVQGYNTAGAVFKSTEYVTVP
ncbi:MAG: alkaline phosphatase family protein [Terriglobales bacterium]